MSFPAPSSQLGPSIIIWINSLPSSSPWSAAANEEEATEGRRRVVESLNDLNDGVIFGQIVAEVDPAYFRPLINSSVQKDNWVLKFNNLKRLYKLLIRYFEDVLRSSTLALPAPNLQVIAKSDIGADRETCRLAGLILALVVQSEKRQYYVQLIQSLEEWVQRELMVSIEQVMSKINRKTARTIGNDDDPDSEFYSVQQDRSRLLSDKDSLQLMYDELLRNYQSLQEDHEEALLAVTTAEKKASEVAQQVEKEKADRVDVGVRAELNRVKAQLQKTEDQLSEAEQVVEKQSRTLEDLTKKLGELEPKAAEAIKLKDQMDEYRHAIEKAKKAENVIEKYKKKLEDSADLRKSMRTLEEENSELLDRYGTLEEEHAKLAAFKPLMDSYKSKVDALETRASDLTKQNDRLKIEVARLTDKLRVAEDEKDKDRDALVLYEERVKELEAGPTPRKSRAGRPAEGGDDEEDSFDVGGELDDAMRGTTMTDLKLQIRKLTRQLDEARKNSADKSRVVVLENLLEDANRMKSKYETDYLGEHRSKLGIEAKLDEIMDGKSRLGDGPEAALALRMRLNETVEELDRLRRDHAQLEVQFTSQEEELTIAKSDLTLVNQDQLDILKSLRASVSVEKEAIAAELEELRLKVREADDKAKMQMSQINALLLEKISLQSDGIDQREKMLSRERDVGDLRASLSSKGMTEADQARIAALEDENKRNSSEVKDLKEKLLKAKAFIKNQDKLFQERHAADGHGLPEEDARAYRSQITQLKEVIERQKSNSGDLEARYLREQQLMLSAWHEVGMRTMREGIANSNNNVKAQPTSWLAQQRLKSNGRGLRYS